jgi:large subunit ribosomal protein L6
MSRVGKAPVPVVDGVKVSIEDRTVHVEDGKTILVSRQNDERQSRAYHGLTRALVNNMILGVKNGYEKKLEIIGVGYLAAIKGKVLQLRVGFANELHLDIPEGLDVACPDQTHVNIKGCDKQAVGQFAAYIRSLRKPEPYKGKGVRYLGEKIKLKPGKSAT